MASSRQAAAAAALFRQAMGLHREGRLDEAEGLYRRVLAEDRRHTDAMHYLGLLQSDKGHWPEALELMRRAVMLSPTTPHYHSNLAEALRRAGEVEAAVDAARRAVNLAPNSPEDLYNLAVALRDAGQHREAATIYLRVIQLKPDHYKAYNNLGVVLTTLGRFNEAIDAFQRCAAIVPRLPELYSNWARVLIDANRLGEALEKARHALELDPNDATAHCNVGRCVSNWFDLDDAVASFRRALELKPDYALAHSNLLFVMLHQAGVSDQELVDEHAAWGARHAPTIARKTPHPNDGDPSRPLRVGYISPDLREHPVAFFIEPVLANHSAEIEVFCYSNAPLAEHDQVTERIKSYGMQWRDVIDLSDAKLARLIEADRIDVLVDLAGHTGNNRLQVFAHQPAPVQATYLGYQTTSGVEAIKYRLTDSLVDPAGLTDPHYTEQLVRMELFACYRPPPDAPEVASPPCMQRGHVTFGAYTKSEKISRPTLQLWSAVLQRVPGAKLSLFAGAFDELSIAQRLRELLAKHGIDPSRVEITGRQPMQQYLRSHEQVDVLLDTIPFNGHTTTCHALWMGVPTITLAGSRYASRMGMAVMTHLGLPEFVASSTEQFVEIAASLASDAPRLAELRATMRDRLKASALMDEPRFARGIERAYRDMWHQWCKSDVA
jgi:predicted O-linked N-acetylglucosamine transferase (SPINDLY family)